ncbi:MAG TPA: hypothetical protein PL123_08255 [Bacteroidales bacterium]|nr:hypothetical protein [Bacteroidales bacterium]
MKNIFKIFSILALAVVFSCEDSKYNTNCDECDETEPVEVVISAQLSNPHPENGVIVKLYEGKLEDKVLYDSAKIFFTTKFERRVPPNKTYTATATYIIDGKEYTITDSTTPRVKYTEDLCDNPCYFTYNKKLNLRYKYIK